MISLALWVYACGDDSVVGGPSAGADAADDSAASGGTSESQGSSDAGPPGAADLPDATSTADLPDATSTADPPDATSTAEPGAPSAGGASDGGVHSIEDSGGNSAGTEACSLVDGKLSYGPVGEPWPWPLDSVSPSSRDCFLCGASEADYSAFRAGEGYGFVWRSGYDEAAPAPNLFGMTVDSNFAGGEPRPLAPASPVVDFELAASEQGVLISTCSLDSGPLWIWLNTDLEVAGPPSFTREGVSCEAGIAPPVVWTGEGYLTAFTDARGLVVAALDQQGTLVEEAVLSEEAREPAVARFSRNGDRVLFVFNAGEDEQLRYSLLDLEGTPLGDAQPFGVVVDSARTKCLLTTNGDGWWALNDTGSIAELPATLTQITRDGLAISGDSLGELSVSAFVPSTHGGSLLFSSWYEDDLGGHSFSRTLMIDDDGAVVFSAELDYAFDGPWLEDVVTDPFRDLLVEQRRVEGELGHRVIQEYGCLD